jgi:hypothetical protein
MEYNSFDPDHELWYLHSREFTIESFQDKLDRIPQVAL